jgi:hypothetical protein
MRPCKWSRSSTALQRGELFADMAPAQVCLWTSESIRLCRFHHPTNRTLLPGVWGRACPLQLNSKAPAFSKSWLTLVGRLWGAHAVTRFNMRNCSCLKVVLLLLWLLSGRAWSQTGIMHYYVSSAGNDANSGSRIKPWRTLQHAADQAALGQAGTMIHVAPGTYREIRYCSVPGLVKVSAMVCMLHSGTATQPIIFESDRQWAAKLRCPQSSAMFILIASYVRVIGFDMSCPKEGSFAGATYGDNGHNEFLNNYLHDFDVTGCTSLGVLNGTIGAQPGWTSIGHHVVSGNVIRHAGASAGAAHHCNQEHGLYFSDPYDVLTHNLISGMIGVGIHSFGHGICHQVISNNTIFDNSQGGIVLENIATKDREYWNLCDRGTSDFNTVTNNIIVHNGIGQNYSGEYGGIDGRGLPGGGHNVFSNNLIYGNQPYETALERPDISVNQLSGNDTSVFTKYEPDRNWAPTPHYDVCNYGSKAGSRAVGALDTATCPRHSSP